MDQLVGAELAERQNSGRNTCSSLGGGLWWGPVSNPQHLSARAYKALYSMHSGPCNPSGTTMGPAGSKVAGEDRDSDDEGGAWRCPSDLEPPGERLSPTEHGIIGLDTAITLGSSGVNADDLCGDGWELSATNGSSECYGDGQGDQNEATTVSEYYRKGKASSTRDQDGITWGNKVSAAGASIDARQRPSEAGGLHNLPVDGPGWLTPDRNKSKMLCDVGAWMEDGRIVYGKDQKRCCRPKPRPSHAAPPNTQCDESTGKCTDGGITGSRPGFPGHVNSAHRSHSPDGLVEWYTHPTAGLRPGNPEWGMGPLSGIDLKSVGKGNLAESNCHWYKAHNNNCSSYDGMPDKCHHRYEQVPGTVRAGGDWRAISCKWWGEDQRCHSKKDLSNAKIFEIDQTDFSGCNCFDSEGKRPVPCGDYYHRQGAGVPKEKNIDIVSSKTHAAAPSSSTHAAALFNQNDFIGYSTHSDQLAPLPAGARPTGYPDYEGIPITETDHWAYVPPITRRNEKASTKVLRVRGSMGRHNDDETLEPQPHQDPGAADVACKAPATLPPPAPFVVASSGLGGCLPDVFNDYPSSIADDAPVRQAGGHIAGMGSGVWIGHKTPITD